LAAWGVRSIILRQTSPTFEGFLLVSTLGLCVWRVTNHPSLGVAGFLAALVLVALLPAIVARLRRYSEPWKERDWRRLLRVAIVVQFVLHLAAGLVEFPDPSTESASLAELRRRISTIDSVPRVTLMTPSTAPESLLFVLRSQWPDSKFVLAGSSEGSAFNDAVTPTSSTESKDGIVIEWTRFEFRLATEFTPNQQTTAIGNPLRFRGRRLMVYRVSPREH
jgi:hypothetical protein